MDLECFECEWSGVEAAHPIEDPDDLRCPECMARLPVPETVGALHAD